MPKEEIGIRSKYNPSKKDKESIEHVYHRKEQMRSARSDWENEWDDAEKAYEGRRAEQKLSEWQSDIYIPLTSSVVESMLSELVDLNLQPLYLPREPQDQSAATVMNHVFKYTWEIGNGDMELYKVIKDALIYGTGIAQEYYLATPRDVKELIKFDPEKGIEEYEDREIKDFDDVYMEAVKLQDFYVDERARGFTGPRGARDCIRRYIMHIEDFKAFFKGPIWDPKKNAKYVVAGGDTNYYEFYNPPQGIDKEDVEVLWYWNKPDDKLTIVANDVIVRDSPNPYSHKQLPFARAVDILNPHQFYGKGEPKLLEGLQEEMNIHRRMLMDRGHLDIDKMFKVSAREVIDEEDLVARPHGFIPLEDPGAFEPLEYGDVHQSVYKGLELMRDDIVRVTGYDDRMQAVRSPGTATEAAILKESALRRVRAKVFILGKEFLVNVGRLRMANIQQYYSVPKVEKILGDKETREYREGVAKAKQEGRFRQISGQGYEEKYRTIRIEDRLLEKTKDGEVIESPHQGWSFFEADPDTIRGNFDISITAGPILPVSKPLLQQRMETLAQHPVIMAGIESQIYDPVKIGDGLLKAHDMNPDDFKLQQDMTEQAPEAKGASQLEQEVELASIENEQMMKGTALAPTPYISWRHTQVHLAFANSEQFRALGNQDEIVKNVFTHIYGEMEAQRRRGEELPQEPGQGGVPKKQGMLGKAVGAIKGLIGGKPKPVEEARATIPAKAVGSEQVQKIV